MVVVALVGTACDKKEDDPPVSAPLPPAQPGGDRLSTGIGSARAIDPEAVPAAARWQRSIAVDGQRAAFVGEMAGDPIALTTSDGGRTWRAVRGEQSVWSAWAVGADATLVLSSGTRTPKAGTGSGAIDSVRVAFATPDAGALSPATPVLPVEGSRSRPRIVADSLLAAVLGRDAAAFVVEEAPGRGVIHYGGRPGVVAGPQLRLPPGERPMAAPMGQPPMLLTLRGRELLARRLPAPGTPLEPPAAIAGALVTPALGAELSATPACEAAPVSFQRIKQGAKRAVLAVSPARSSIVVLPDDPPAKPAPPPRPASSAAAPGATTLQPAFGCNASSFVIESARGGEPSLTRCGLEGACVAPPKSPFQPWPEATRRSIAATPTATGVVALHSAQAGERWGVYLVQSADGTSYELPRVVAEGSGDRGRLEVGGLVSIGNRVLLLLAGDLVGTSRRGWYVLATDDGGAHWSAP